MTNLETEYKNRCSKSGNFGHWFDKETLKFFKSRIGASRTIRENIYFLSSEQFDNDPRMFTVRKMHPSGDITNHTEFMALTYGQAARVLKQLT